MFLALLIVQQRFAQTPVLCVDPYKEAKRICVSGKAVVEKRVSTLKNPSLANVAELNSQLIGLQVACQASLTLCQQECGSQTQYANYLKACSAGGEIHRELASIQAAQSNSSSDFNYQKFSDEETAPRPAPGLSMDTAIRQVLGDDNPNMQKQEPGKHFMLRYTVPFGKGGK